MNKSIVDMLISRKIKQIVKYAKILLKSLQEIESDKASTIELYITKYIQYFLFGDTKEEDVVEASNAFCLKNNITNDYQKNVIYVIFDTIPKLMEINLDGDYTKDMILLSKLLAFSIKFDEQVSSASDDNANSSEAVNQIAKELELFADQALWKDITKVKKELRTNANQNAKVMKKFLTTYKSDPFTLNFYQMYDTLDTTRMYTDTELIYDFSELKEYEKKIIDRVYKKSTIPNDHTLIKMEKVSYTIFTDIVKNRLPFLYLISIPDDFLKKKVNFKKMLNFTDVDGIRNKIVFVVNGVQMEKYSAELKELRKKNYNIALDDMVYLDNSLLRIKTSVDYLFVDESWLKNMNQIMVISEDNKIHLINKKREKEAIFIDV